MNKEESAKTKKLRIFLGIDKYQAEMIKKKVNCSTPQELAVHFLNVCEQLNLKEFIGQVQYLLNGNQNSHRFIGIIGQLAYQYGQVNNEIKKELDQIMKNKITIEG